MTLERIKELIASDSFYLSKEWRIKRKKILEEQHYECQRCKALGKFSFATIVHHRKHLKERPDLAFDDDNLMAVCDECHNILHPEKLKKPKPKWNDEKW